MTNPAMAYHAFYNCLLLTTQQHFRLTSTNPSAQREPGRPWFNEDAKSAVSKARAAFNVWSGDPLNTFNRIAWKRAEAQKRRFFVASRVNPGSHSPPNWIREEPTR
jgi:hypothetical protein